MGKERIFEMLQDLKTSENRVQMEAFKTELENFIAIADECAVDRILMQRDVADQLEELCRRMKKSAVEKSLKVKLKPIIEQLRGRA